MKTVLMVSPEFFDVEYAINPYMTSNDGQLHKIDKSKAKSQWDELKKTYSRLGYHVDVITGAKGLPDMVFAANQSFPYWDYTAERPSVILSNMRSEFRADEVPYFEKYYREKDYQVQRLERYSFEGNGDALIRPNAKEIFGGFGFRTDQRVYEQIERFTRHEVILLDLKDEYFYHLDTCFSFLDEDTVAIVPEAFTVSDLNLLERKLKKIIMIDLNEAKNNFAGNCHCPDGKTVILHPGAEKLKKSLKNNGFDVIEVDTSEYIKSGGSVFCMKMMCY